MGFFQDLLKPKAPKPAPFQPPPIPMLLPGIVASTAAQIAQSSQPSPAAQQLLTPEQTPPQYLGALQEKQMGDEMVKTMAHGMSDRDGVLWAAQSAGKVSDKLPPTDVLAMNAAQTWSQNPTPANQAAAAAAAAKTDYQGPGALAAQGAAWAQLATSVAAAGGVSAPRLTPLAVSGAVLLASAIAANPNLAAPKVQVPAPALPSLPALALPAPELPQLPELQPGPPPTIPPEVQAQMFQAQHPFIALGLDIASGKAPATIRNPYSDG